MNIPSATRGKKKNRAGKKAPERPAKSAEDLDAEMAVSCRL